MNDNEILIALSKGSAHAFELIYNRFHAKVFFIARNYLHDEDAEDVRSACFVKLWELRSDLIFESMASLYGWLRSTARNSCIDYLRKISTRSKKEDQMLADYLLNHETDIFELSDKEAMVVDRLLIRLNGMPNKFRIVFKMRCFDELKFSEIAHQLHADISTVKKRYAKVVKLLKSNNLSLSFFLI